MTCQNVALTSFLRINISPQKSQQFQWTVNELYLQIIATIIRFLLLLSANTILALFLTVRRRRQRQYSSSPTTGELIIHSTYQQNATGAKSSPHQHMQPFRFVKERKHANLLLFASFALYFLTNFPGLVLTALNLAASQPFCSFYFVGDSRVVFIAVTNLLILCNCSLTIFFYGAVSRKFRRPFFCLHGKELIKVVETESAETGSTRSY